MVLVYFLAPGRMKNTVLLLGSLIFYGWGEPKYLPVMAAVILAGYLSARLIGTCQNKRQSKILLAAAVLLEIFPIIYCKYADFFIQNLNVLTGQKIPLLSIAMPLGISFYTFQVISYTVDVYRGDVPAQKNLLTFAAYVAMFPQLVAGPIVRYSDIRSQLENRMHSVEKCAYGIRRFVTGLSKKILIANVLGELIGQFQASEEKSVLFFWMYAVAFMLQIYFDFSGYSDMAIGLGRILGFHFPENFRYPYCAGSITEFWRRWHISLSFWVRDYVFMPLSAELRNWGRWGVYATLLVTFVVIGVWHGAGWTFALYGLFQGVVVCYETMAGKWRTRMLGRLPHGVSAQLMQLRTYLLFALSLLFFRVAKVEDTFYIYRHLLDGFNTNIKELRLGLTDFYWIVFAVAVVMMFAGEQLNGRFDLKAWSCSRPTWLRWSMYVGTVVLIFLFGAFGVENFIYIQF